MTKVKQGAKAIDHLKGIKNNTIQRKKDNKFANTPTGKVRLINGKNVQNDNNKQKNNKQKEKKQVIKDSPDSPDSNSSSPKNNEKNNSPKQTKALNSPNAQSGKNKKKLKKNKTDESNESLEDINEGIVLPEDSIVSQGDVDDVETEEEETDIKLPNILGQSLADDTDEDDTDFEAEEDEESENDDSDKDESPQLKGVQMFKGLLKQRFDSAKKNKSDDDDDDDDYEDDEDEDEDKNEENDDEDDEDDEMDESNLETDSSISPGSKKNKNNASITETEEEDEDDEDEESSPGLKDLLGNSIMDDDDSDEDFEGEDEDDEDIDISDEESEIEVNKDEPEKRTIFIGNIPTNTTRKEIKQVFREFGPIESIRIRGAAPAESGMKKKVAVITNKLHKNLDSILMLVVFKNEESVSKALSMNGKKFKNHFLRVDAVGDKQVKPDVKKAVFLGNLPFAIKDNDVWEHFAECGEIDFIRLIRDKRSRIGKGIGYVNFKNEDSVALALELNGSTLLDREIRVKRCTEEGTVSKSGKKPRTNRNKRSLSAESDIKTPPKKLKVNDNNKTQKPVDGKKILKAKNKLQENGSPKSETKKTKFQGQKANVGKKAKKSKLDKKKKKMAAILTSKSKKAQV